MRIARVEGRAVPLRGDNIDTDRIVPARFLRAVTFEGLEAHLFADDRREQDARAAAGGGRPHPFSDPAYRGASVLLVNANFGCGSSREHAPQALHRWGIRAVVGESFSEIFFGNALALGLPCVTVAREAVERLMARVEADPAAVVQVDLEALAVSIAGETGPPAAAAMPAAAREAFLTGAWDATGLLRARPEEVDAVAARLPYLRGFEP
ncbi:MAG TPA: 3-isopropylmalate dehydratase small subunit [Vicinamibacterales bacterium]|nr:3-isopropylmalate dehydratase small subunit [Vicinamibacterales bacterium]